jgi:hypothetical protein
MLDFGLGQIPGFFQLGERLVGYWKKWRQPPDSETLTGRFVRLFESHGVHRNQIPRFFGHGFQLKDVQTDAALIQCLTDEHLADACQLFGVQRQWLERGEGQARVRHHFYAQPMGFSGFLDGLMTSHQGALQAEVKATLFGVLNRRDVESTLVLSEPIGELNEEMIYRYHHVDVGPLGYWKARVSAAALVAQTLSRKLWINGRNCDAKQLVTFTYDKDLWGLQEQNLLTQGSRRFEVDDWLLKPAAFLEGVDPESNRFGTLSALDLWLTLEAQGQMKHPHSKLGARQQFEIVLAEQKAV